MLDAAHGKAVGPVRIVLRFHGARIEVEVCCVDVSAGVGRRGPIVAARADVGQGPRLTVAVARSRREEQSLD